MSITPEEFVDAALADPKRAEQLLDAHADPHLCSALLRFICFFSHAGDLVETARMLLRRGADPNAFQFDPHWPDSPLPCLYGATGLNNSPPLALALLEAGANPNDSESLYHSTEHPDFQCVKLLLRHGASPKGTNSLKHLLDREDLEGLRVLLDAGADPNERNVRGETSLHWAVFRGRSPAVIGALLDRGADINAVREDGRTAYALALLSGRTGIARLLEQRGAATEVPPLTNTPKSARLLPDLAIMGAAPGVSALLTAGFPVDARGELGGTALHWACWRGYPDIVKLLINHGASLTIEDTQYHGTPAGWLDHGRQNCREPGSDYAEVEQLLRAAGARIPAQETDG